MFVLGIVVRIESIRVEWIVYGGAEGDLVGKGGLGLVGIGFWMLR